MSEPTNTSANSQRPYERDWPNPWPPWWERYAPWDDDPKLDDLIEIMRPKERAFWEKGGSLTEREQFLAGIENRWRSFRRAFNQAKGKPNNPADGYPEQDREPTEAQVTRLMLSDDLTAYKAGSNSKEIYDFYLARFKESEKRERQKFQEQLELRGKAFDLLQRAREKFKDDPTKLATFPPDNCSTEQLLAWYEEGSKVHRPIPFPGEGGYGQQPRVPDVVPREETLGYRMGRALDQNVAEAERLLGLSKDRKSDAGDMAAPGAGIDPKPKWPIGHGPISTTRDGSSFTNPPRQSPAEELVDDVLELFSDSSNDRPVYSQGKDSPASRWRTGFESTKEFFKHLNGLLRVLALGLAIGSLTWSWQVLGADEYGVALGLVALFVVFSLVSLYGWAGVPEYPKATKAIKTCLIMGVSVVAVYSAAVVWQKKGDKPWTTLWATKPDKDPDEAPNLMILKAWGGDPRQGCQGLVDGGLLKEYGSLYDVLIMCGIDDASVNRLTDSAITVSSKYSIFSGDIAIEATTSEPMREVISAKLARGRLAKAPPNMQVNVEVSTWYELALIPKRVESPQIKTLSDITSNGGKLLGSQRRHIVATIKVSP